MATDVQQVTTPQVTPQTPTSAPIEREFTVQSRSQTQQALRRFMHNKLAMAALFVYVVLLLVSFIYPHVDHMTRTQVVRTTLDNPGLLLRPGMYASARMTSLERPMPPSSRTRRLISLQSGATPRKRELSVRGMAS